MIILTLKFAGRGYDRTQTEIKLNETFQGHKLQGRMVWLMANTACEQTWVATKLG